MDGCSATSCNFHEFQKREEKPSNGWGTDKDCHNQGLFVLASLFIISIQNSQTLVFKNSLVICRPCGFLEVFSGNTSGNASELRWLGSAASRFGGYTSPLITLWAVTLHAQNIKTSHLFCGSDHSISGIRGGVSLNSHLLRKESEGSLLSWCPCDLWVRWLCEQNTALNRLLVRSSLMVVWRGVAEA